MLRYQKDSLISCVIWQRNTNCNTEMVQSIATLNTVLVKKTLWYFLFRFCSMNHPHLRLLHFLVIYVRFLQWGLYIICYRLEWNVVWVAVFQRSILIVSWGDCLKVDVVCLFRLVFIPDYLVSVWKDTISMLSVSNDVMKWRGDGFC